eukprot:451082-Prorocentrum_minimum.AAC.1
MFIIVITKVGFSRGGAAPARASALRRAGPSPPPPSPCPPCPCISAEPNGVRGGGIYPRIGPMA